MGPRDFTLYDLIERNARLFPDRPAMVFGTEHITHAEYLTRVHRLASALAAVGIGPGDRVAALSTNRPELLDLLGAVARIGAILVPVNWRSSPAEIAYVLADTTPRLVVAESAFEQVLAQELDGMVFVERWHAFDDGSGRLRPWAELVTGDAALPPHDASAADTIVIIHTAAIAGHPRGAMLSHGGLMAASLQLVQRLSVSPADVHLGMLPLFHLTGLTLSLAAQLAGGATVLCDRFDAAQAVWAIEREHVTLFATFPPMLGALLDAAAASRITLSSVRAVMGLEAPDTVQRFETACPQARFWSGYGQTECGMVSLSPFRERPGAAGRPLPLAALATVDDAGDSLPAGTTGEIVVRGPTVFLGYWGRESDTADTFRGGWHHTGDLGRLDEDGFLWYTGRAPAKELIKTGGENVYPSEVERALLAHPAVAEAVVFGVPDPKWGEAVRAVCACRPGQNVASADLIEFVASRIARYKRPRGIVFLERLPRTAGGAVDRERIKRDHAGDASHDCIDR